MLPGAVPDTPWPSTPQEKPDEDSWPSLVPGGSWIFNSSNTSSLEICPYDVGEKVPYEELPRNLTESMPCPFPLQVYPTWEVALKVSAYLVTMLITVLGNLLLVIIVVVNKHMHTSTNYYICALAVSDIIVGMLVMWSHLGTSITSDWPFGAVICKAFEFFQMCALTESVLCMTVIAMDRFVAIVSPIRARMLRHHAPAVISVTWLLALLVALPNLVVRVQKELFWADRHQVWCTEVWPRYYVGFIPPDEGGSVGRCVFDYPERRIYYTAQVVVMYFVPIAVMSVTYCIIAWTLWKRRIPGIQTDALILTQQKAKRKVVRMLIVVFVAFVVCWTPQEVMVLLMMHCPVHTEECDDFPVGVRYACQFIAYFNCALNPLLYAGLNGNFRKGFREAFRCRLAKHNRVAPVLHSAPQGGGTGSSTHDMRVSSPTSLKPPPTCNPLETQHIYVTYASQRIRNPKTDAFS